MNTTKLAFLLALILHLSSIILSCSAAPFDCGSNGTNGALNITSDTTLDLPPDGIFNYTTITVAQGATLKFNRNALNTPAYLLATGDVVINGTIDVSAVPASRLGGPGGFDGGYGTGPIAGGSPSDGQGPGGGKYGVPYGDYGVFGNGGPDGVNTRVYGNLLLMPMIGGSSGAGDINGPAGGGGGGAILIASNTKIVVAGYVQSLGGYAENGLHGGSGGAVRLVAPIVSGGGTLSALGRVRSGAGRIRIDCQDNQAYRSLNLGGVASRGMRMIVFPAVLPALDIIELAGQAIPEGMNSPVLFELAVGANTNQTVRVQARNFTNDVPIRVVVTPEHGPSGSFDATILQSSGNPPSTNVNVIIPAGSVCQIHAWTR
jgi:hypothetical protein